MGSDLLELVVRREPLPAAGKSGAQLERAWLDDGSTVVIKHADAAADWIMQATGDAGRVAAMWADGTFGRLPASIEHAILDVQPAAGGATVVMRDVASHLAPGDRMPESLHHRVLSAARDSHAAFAGASLPQLCDLRRYYTFLSPSVCERFAVEHDVPRLALQGWTRFHEVVASDVVEAIAAVHDDPGPLVDALLARDRTLVHGDLKLANLGNDDDRVIMLDWGTLTCWAPASVDYAWYLAINTAAIGRDPGEILDDVRRAQHAPDEVALRLALIGALAQLGWEKALGATANDPETRQRERAALEWWTRKVREAFPQM
ncbi:MAG TPA: hypothetical protein VGH43_13445 [Jatrophihabitans sp.]